MNLLFYNFYYLEVLKYILYKKGSSFIDIVSLIAQIRGACFINKINLISKIKKENPYIYFISIKIPYSNYTYLFLI